jgi:hypothetical protein
MRLALNAKGIMEVDEAERMWEEAGVICMLWCPIQGLTDAWVI